MANTRKNIKIEHSIPHNLHLIGNQSTVTWIISSFIILFLFIAPFEKGLFNGTQPTFDHPIYVSFVWSFVFATFFAIYLLIKWKPSKMEDYLPLIIWLVPLSYFFSYFTAASQSMAMHSLYIHLSYAVFFIFGYYLTNNRQGAYLLQGSLLLSSYLIVLFGMINWFGNSLYTNAVMIDSNGPRLTSVFQYANTYAAFLIAVIISSLFLIVMNRRWYITILASFMLIPSIISLLLTLSRGGLVLLPVIILLIIPFIALARQISFFFHFIISLAVAFIILDKITVWGLSLQKTYTLSQSFQAWALLLVVSLIVAGISFLFQRYAEPWLNRKISKLSKLRFSTILVPATAIIIGIISVYVLLGDTGFTKMLPSNIKHRLETINLQQHSVLERETFYQDALKIVKDYPIFGAGGGAWAALYEKYQHNPYVSKQAHNFYMQYLVEVGLFGFILLLFLLLFIFYRYIRSFTLNQDDAKYQHFVFFIFVVSLLVHSAIDFDLSYVYLGAILFLSLGGMLTGTKSKNEIQLKSSHWVIKWSKAYPTFLIIVSILSLIMSIRMLYANNLYNKAVQDIKGHKPFNTIMTNLNQAITLAENPYYVNLKIDILRQVYTQTKKETSYNEALQTLDQLKKNEPYNDQLMENEYNLYMMKKNYTDALKATTEAITNHPWKIALYDRVITLNFNIGNQSKSIEERDQYWKKALQYYQDVLQRVHQLTLLPKGQNEGQPFYVTPNIALSVGQIYYLQKNYNDSENVLKKALTGNMKDQQQRFLARWYLAALQKQGKNDAKLYQKLIQADPQEKANIATLLQYK